MAKMQYTNRLAEQVGNFVSDKKEEGKPAPMPVTEEKPAKETKKKEPETKKVPAKAAETREVNKGGRPKTEDDSEKLTILIRTKYKEDLEMVSNFLYGGSKTKYINDLIAKDLEENKDKYDMMRKIKR